MKTIPWLLATMLWLGSTNTSLANDEIQKAFQNALFEEEARQNPAAAIESYQAVLKHLEAHRKMAATTVFRLGECYRKLGQTNEAKVQYERVVREFSDQAVLVKLSEQNLVGLGFGKEEKVRPQVPAAPGLADRTFSPEAAQIRALQELIKNSPDLINALDVSTGEPLAPLHRAIKDGMIEVVKFLLANGANVHVRAGNGQHPLALAADKGHKTIVELLLAHGAEVNQKKDDGSTALHAAAERGFETIAEVLIQAKADVNAQTKTGLAPLHKIKDVGLLRFFLKSGANVNARNTAGETPLHYAAQRADLESVRLLIEHGAEVNAAASEGWTPLHRAAHAGAFRICELLMKNSANPNLPLTGDFRHHSIQCFGFTPLHLATLQQDESLVKVLVTHGAEVNARGDRDQTPLHLSMIYGLSAAITKILLAHGADVNAITRDSESPLLMAIKRNAQEQVKLLLEYQPDLELRCQQNMTALQHAVSKPNESIAKLLLEAGASPNVAHFPSGDTPLHWAATHMNRELVSMLLKHDANPNSLNARSQTPMDAAKALLPQSQSPGIQLARGPSHSPALVAEIIQLLREAGATEYPRRASSIMIGRDGQYAVVFPKEGHSQNRYTLMEAIGIQYSARFQTTSGGSSFHARLAQIQQKGLPQHHSENSDPLVFLPFPDFSQVRIHRLKGSAGNDEKVLTIDLAQAFQSGDCSKDIPLEWGDMIEVPEKSHKLNEQWPGLSYEEMEPLRRCLRRSVKVLIHTKERLAESRLAFDMFAAFQQETRPDLLDMNQPPPPRLLTVGSFHVMDVLQAANILLSTSDLTKVKVWRGGGTGSAQEFIVNLFDPAQSVWLRDGDVIEVPEK